MLLSVIASIAAFRGGRLRLELQFQCGLVGVEWGGRR